MSEVVAIDAAAASPAVRRVSRDARKQHRHHHHIISLFVQGNIQERDKKAHTALRIAKIELHKQAVREAATICLRPLQVDFDLLTLKVVSESRVTWATSVPILVFLGHSVYRLTHDVRERQASDVRRASSLNAPNLGAGV